MVYLSLSVISVHRVPICPIVLFISSARFVPHRDMRRILAELACYNRRSASSKLPIPARNTLARLRDPRSLLTAGGVAALLLALKGMAPLAAVN